MNSYPVDEYGLPVGPDGKPLGGIKSEAVDVRALGEARHYSLLNPYLSTRQKAILETWYQLPSVSFFYTYLITSAAITGDPVLLKPVFLAIYSSLFFGWVMTLSDESILEPIMPFFAILKNELLMSALVFISCILGGLGWWSGIALLILTITGMASPGGQLSSAWAIKKHPSLHPKYGASKEIFGIREFAFEKYLPDDKANEYVARGKVAICWMCSVVLIALTIAFGR